MDSGLWEGGSAEGPGKSLGGLSKQSAVEVEASGARRPASWRHSRDGETEERHFLVSLTSEELGSDAKQCRCEAKTCVFF